MNKQPSLIRGTLTWCAGRRGGTWTVAGDADMMIRLKRILPKVNSQVGGTFTVDCTDETCRDLDWALGRWPLSMSKADRLRLTQAAQRHIDREQKVRALLDADSQGSNRAAEGWVTAALALRYYQEQARDIALTTGGTLVVDDLGLGKTAIGFSIAENPAARPLLAVTLTNLPRQFIREANKFYPDLKAIPLVAGTKLPDEGEGLPDADIYVIPYSMLSKWQHHLAGQINAVVFDEVQELRRKDSQKWVAAKTIADAALFRVGLTATPLYNHGGELWNILNVIAPSALGTYTEFKREWASSTTYGVGGTEKVTIANPDALRASLKSQGVMLRRTREDVGIKLPPVEPIEQFVPSDPAVLDKLTGNSVEIAKLILRQDAAREERWRAAGDLNWMMRQATGIAKAPFVADFTRLLLEAEERLVLFGWHRAVYDIWMERLADLNPQLYTGSESSAAKQRSLDRFLEGDARILIMSLHSGAGLDGLQDKANTAVFGELDWSPGVHRQCLGRLGRPGQKKPVKAWFCVTDSGSDPAMLDVINTKALSVDALVDGTAGRPDHALAETGATDRMKLLAASVLQQQGLAVDAA